MKMHHIKLFFTCLIFCAVSILNTGCHSLTKTQKGASIGAGAGGVIGAFIGKSAGNTALGAIIGGAVGGTAGAFIGKSMDSQAAELKQTITGATIVRQGDAIVVKFDSGILFDTNKAEIKPDAEANLKNLAASLKKNQDTNVLIIGHTDNSKADTRNSSLSLERADAVKAFIVNNAVDSYRLNVQGKGAADPVADNSTAEGRAKNRRVEIVISANKHMIEKAKSAQE